MNQSSTVRREVKPSSSSTTNRSTTISACLSSTSSTSSAAASSSSSSSVPSASTAPARSHKYPTSQGPIGDFLPQQHKPQSDLINSFPPRSTVELQPSPSSEEQWLMEWLDMQSVGQLANNNPTLGLSPKSFDPVAGWSDFELEKLMAMPLSSLTASSTRDGSSVPFNSISYPPTSSAPMSYLHHPSVSSSSAPINFVPVSSSAAPMNFVSVSSSSTPMHFVQQPSVSSSSSASDSNSNNQALLSMHGTVQDDMVSNSKPFLREQWPMSQPSELASVPAETVSLAQKQHQLRQQYQQHAFEQQQKISQLQQQIMQQDQQMNHLHHQAQEQLRTRDHRLFQMQQNAQYHLDHQDQQMNELHQQTRNQLRQHEQHHFIQKQQLDEQQRRMHLQQQQIQQQLHILNVQAAQIHRQQQALFHQQVVRNSIPNTPNPGNNPSFMNDAAAVGQKNHQFDMMNKPVASSCQTPYSNELSISPPMGQSYQGSTWSSQPAVMHGDHQTALIPSNDQMSAMMQQSSTHMAMMHPSDVRPDEGHCSHSVSSVDKTSNMYGDMKEQPTKLSMHLNAKRTDKDILEPSSIISNSSTIHRSNAVSAMNNAKRSNESDKASSSETEKKPGPKKIKTIPPPIKTFPALTVDASLAWKPLSTDFCISMVNKQQTEYTVDILQSNSLSSRFGSQTCFSSIVLLTPRVAQKSYGSEKRFFCPPPLVHFCGSLWDFRKRALNAEPLSRDDYSTLVSGFPGWHVSMSPDPSGFCASLPCGGRVTTLRLLDEEAGLFGPTPSETPAAVADREFNFKTEANICYPERSHKAMETVNYASTPVPNTFEAVAIFKNIFAGDIQRLQSIFPSVQASCSQPSGSNLSKALAEFLYSVWGRRFNNKTRKDFELYVRVDKDPNVSVARRQLGTFRSSPITLISKPSKKRIVSSNSSSQSKNSRKHSLRDPTCIHSSKGFPIQNSDGIMHNTTVALYNRMKSQNVTTRCLGIHRVSSLTNPQFVAKSISWDPLVMSVVDHSGRLAKGHVHVRYGSAVILKCMRTGWHSPVFYIRQADGRRKMRGHSTEDRSESSRSDDEGINELEDPVTHLHKISLELRDNPNYYLGIDTDTKMVQGILSDGQNIVDTVTLRLQPPTTTFESICGFNDNGDISMSSSSAQQAKTIGIPEVAVWTIVGVDVTCYQWLDPLEIREGKSPATYKPSEKDFPISPVPQEVVLQITDQSSERKLCSVEFTLPYHSLIDVIFNSTAFERLDKDMSHEEPDSGGQSIESILQRRLSKIFEFRLYFGNVCCIIIDSTSAFDLSNSASDSAGSKVTEENGNAETGLKLNITFEVPSWETCLQKGKWLNDLIDIFPQAKKLKENPVPSSSSAIKPVSSSNMPAMLPSPSEMFITQPSDTAMNMNPTNVNDELDGNLLFELAEPPEDFDFRYFSPLDYRSDYFFGFGSEPTTVNPAAVTERPREPDDYMSAGITSNPFATPDLTPDVKPPRQPMMGITERGFPHHLGARAWQEMPNSTGNPVATVEVPILLERSDGVIYPTGKHVVYRVPFHFMAQ